MAADPREQRAILPRPTAADREAIVARLSDAFAHDALSLEEFEQRVVIAYRATSATDLATLVADLAKPAKGSPPSTKEQVAVTEVAPRRIAAIFSNVERQGPIEIPPRLDIRSYFGNVELDLSTASFSPGVTEISIRVFCGNAELRVPADAIVENLGTSILASFTSNVPERAESVRGAGTRVRLRITGRAILGNVAIDAPASPDDRLLSAPTAEDEV